MMQTVTQSGFKTGDVVIKARLVYPTGALVVDGRDARGRLLAHPLGGGPQYIVSSKGESELRIVAADEQKQPLWRRTRFSLDGLDGSFEGWTNGELWNGWDRPFFELIGICFFDVDGVCLTRCSHSRRNEAELSPLSA